jgi:hypothetical protein
MVDTPANDNYIFGAADKAERVMCGSRFYPALFALATSFSQSAGAAVTVEQYHIHDFAFKANVNGNPFDVELHGEFSGPSGAHVTVPGFYDGGDIWKIRFSPPSAGNWSMRTVSAVPALNNHEEQSITATPNTNKAIHGRLMVDALNPYHFVYEDGSRYFLMGYEADWLAEADMKDPERKVMHHLIDQIAARGFNHMITAVFAYDTSWSKGNQNQWDYGPPAMYVFGGTNEHPDHSVLNTAYFKIYDGMVQALQDKGIVADIMFKVYNKGVNWPPPGSKEEERYYRYVTARYQAYSNVVWAFSKEEFNEPNKVLEKSLIERIRETDGYHHLTTTHTDGPFTWDPALGSNVVDFDLDQEHGAYWPEKPAFERALRRRPYLNSELYYEIGVDNLPTYPPRNSWQDMIRGAYNVYLSGGYFAYYYGNTAWDLVKPDPEPPGMAPMQILKENLSALPYWKMEPKPELALGGPCLARPGEVYACYVAPLPPRPAPAASAGAKGPPLPAQVRRPNPPIQRGGEIVLNLTGLKGSATLDWVNTWTGEHVDASVDHPAVYALRRPESFGAAPALLIVKGVSSG